MSTVAPQINTYHCLCASLLLATTHYLPSLPRRASPGLDGAVILVVTSVLEPTPEPALDVLESETSNERLGYSLLLGTTLDSRATIIRRSDGFEKRHLLRCGRCRLVIGYELDAVHRTAAESMAIPGDGAAGQKTGERARIAYILPGRVMSTEAMAAGRIINEHDVALVEEKMAGVVWE